MSFLDLFRQKKDDSAARRDRLLKTGRIAEGSVIDAKLDERGRITQISYYYSISGVEYESSQDLNADQAAREADYAPGARITIRYDHRQPANSTVV
jgi:uncharacterized protein DUF3592